jgi:excisionase family DNA binding protein
MENLEKNKKVAEKIEEIESLLTPEEAAAYLKVKPETLASWRHFGKPELQYFRVGRLIRYRMSDIINFVGSGRVS